MLWSRALKMLKDLISSPKFQMHKYVLCYLLSLTDPDDDSSPDAEEIKKLENAEKAFSTRSSVPNVSDCQG